MLKKQWLLIPVVILALLAGCAKRNTEWQDGDVLTLEATLPVVGNPLDISFDADNIYIAQDQGGISIFNAVSYASKWVTRIYADDGSGIALGRIKKISLLPDFNRMFLNEVSATDRIVILDTSDPDTLVYKFDIVGGTGGIKAMEGFNLDPPNGNWTMAIGYCSGEGFKYDRYDGGVFNENLYAVPTPATASGFDLTAERIYLTCEQRGLFIYNRSDRQYLGEIALPGEAQKVKVAGNYAYVACRQGGLQVVDVSNPAQPVLVGSYDTSGYATTVDVSGTQCVVSSGSGGVYLFDIATPQTPVLKQRLNSVGWTNIARFHSGKLIVATRDEGVLVYAID